MDLAKLVNICTSKESQDIVSSLILRKRPLPDSAVEENFNGCMKKIGEFRGREFRRSVLKEDSVDNSSKARQLMELRRRNKFTIDSI